MIIAHFFHRPKRIQKAQHAAVLRAGILNARAHANRGSSVLRERHTRRYNLAYSRAYRRAQRQRTQQELSAPSLPTASDMPAPVAAMSAVQ